jgi:hypothetical protein
MSRHFVLTLLLPLLLAPAALHAQTAAQAQTQPAHPAPVLLELFTSEGCSSCPPADELLRKVNGRQTAQGQLIIGLSEHVTYWNGLGWKDPYASAASTDRQNSYGARFHLDSVYTPQMVVNGREQFVGGDTRALQSAFAAEAQRSQAAQRSQLDLRILSAKLTDKDITFTYAAAALPAHTRLQLLAILTDDSDRSNVLHGENSGRLLAHTAVARSLAPLGPLQPTTQRSITLPLPPSFVAAPGAAHHLVLFAQEADAGPILGADTTPL